MAVIVGHIILISAQVNTRRGVPVLEAVTFGVFAEVQRAATSGIGGVRDVVAELLRAAGDPSARTSDFSTEVAQLRVGLQQERALAAAVAHAAGAARPADGDAARRPPRRR